MVEFVEVEAGGLRFKLVKGLLYTESDEWIRVEDGVLVVGITDYAQKKLKDIVGVELPEPGRRVSKGETVAVVESIKATGEVYAPVDGEVVEVNERLLDEPELVNTDPYGEGWIYKLRAEGEPEGLLDWQAYLESVKRREG
ncbi:MAG: glycine cleavage system protein GcvH [Desulfurococcales archaeon]|nr:glycine cleavage system protein GcvH [Desulfurococcales archaeon]